MSWLVNMLLDAIRSIIAGFIVDALNVVNQVFLDLLSCDLDLFEELFAVAKPLYQSVIRPIGIAILFLILLWKLFTSMFGRLGTDSEEPIQLVCRSTICFVMVLYAKNIMNYILAFAGTPYSWITNEKVVIGSFSELNLKSESIVSLLGIDSMNCMILLTIMQFVIAWHYFKLIYTVAERYVLLGVMAYTSPLAFSTGGSKSTNRILSSWCSMFGGQIVLIMLDAWGLKLFLSGYGGIIASGYGFQKYFAACLCLVGLSKVIQKLDTYLASLGISMGRAASGMSGITVAMLAGRILSRTGKSMAGGNGGSGSSGNQYTNENKAGKDGASADVMMQSSPIPTMDSMTQTAEGVTGDVNKPEEPLQESKEDDNKLDGIDMSAFDEDIGDVSGLETEFNDSLPDAEGFQDENGNDTEEMGEGQAITDLPQEGIGYPDGEMDVTGAGTAEISGFTDGETILGTDGVNKGVSKGIQTEKVNIPEYANGMPEEQRQYAGRGRIHSQTDWEENKVKPMEPPHYHTRITDQGVIQVETKTVSRIPRKEDET